MRHSYVSHLTEDGVDHRLEASRRGVPGSGLDTVAAFHLATAGGADVLGIPVGRFQAGLQFDAFVVDTAASASGLRRWDGIDTEERLFEKIVRLASAADIASVRVAGRKV